MLGQVQWIWFEDILRTSNETFTLIVSPTQILPFNRILTEAWYGESRKKLFSIIGKLKKSGVILITGDIHEGEILKTFCVIEGIFY